jgi:acyl carrier protein
MSAQPGAMDMAEFDRVFDAVVARAVGARGRRTVSDSLDLIEVGFDSLAMVDLMLDLEDALGLDVDPEEKAANMLRTVVGELRGVYRGYAGCA